MIGWNLIGVASTSILYNLLFMIGEQVSQRSSNIKIKSENKKNEKLLEDINKNRQVIISEAPGEYVYIENEQ